MSGQQEGLATKVDLCIDEYASAHKGKFPDVAILTPQVYELLKQDNLLLFPSGHIGPDEIDKENERACLQNTAEEVIEIYRIDEVPTKIRHQLNLHSSRLPLHLCRTGLIRKIDKKSIDSFSLEATASELALV